MKEQGRTTTTHENNDQKKDPNNEQHKPNSTAAAAATEATSKDPFVLIERGNALEASENHWAASDFFSRASVVLIEQASGMEASLDRSSSSSSVETDSKEEKKKEEEERRKIAELYRTQSIEYLRRARGSLLRALEFERDEDLRRAASSLGYHTPPLMALLSKEDLQRRNCIFQRTFAYGSLDEPSVSHQQQPQSSPLNSKGASGGSESPSKTVAVQTDPYNGSHKHSSNTTESDLIPPPPPHENDDEEPPNNNNNNDAPKDTLPPPTQLSLEERLALLDSTLPPPPKSNEERLQDLGVYVPSSSTKDKAAPFKELSEEEQLREIINMAQDEAELMLKDNHTDESQLPKYDDAEQMLRDSGIRIDLPQEQLHDPETMGGTQHAEEDDQDHERLLDDIAKTKNEVSQLDDVDDDDDQDSSRRDTTTANDRELVARIHANVIDDLDLTSDKEEEDDTIQELAAEELLQNMGIDIHQPPSHVDTHKKSDGIKNDNEEETKGDDSAGNNSNKDVDNGVANDTTDDNCVKNTNDVDDVDTAADETKGDDNNGNERNGNDDNETNDNDGDSEGDKPKDLKNGQ